MIRANLTTDGLATILLALTQRAENLAYLEETTDSNESEPMEAVRSTLRELITAEQTESFLEMAHTNAAYRAIWKRTVAP